jgi:hypothetical protein
MDLTTTHQSTAQDELERRIDERHEPGVDEMLEAYREIEVAYHGAAAATSFEPEVITTNSAWA